METFMNDDLKRLNDRQKKQDIKDSERFGLMDKTVNELFTLWINTNRDMYIEFEGLMKSLIINKNKLGIIDIFKSAYNSIIGITRKNNRLFYVGIDIILVGIILYMCKVGR